MQLSVPPRHPLAKRLRRRGWFRYVVAVVFFVGVVWLGWVRILPGIRGSRLTEMPLTATVSRGDLKITVNERGELEAIDAVTVSCETRGGGKLMTIVPEGTRVAKGDVVCQLDPEAYTKLHNEQRVKYEVAVGKVKSAKSDHTQAVSKAATEVAKAEKVLKLAKIDLESYSAPDGEYTKENENLKGELELAKKELVESEEDLDFTKTQVRKGFGDLNAVKAKELAVQQRRFRVAGAQAALTVLENYTRRKKVTELEFNAADAERELKSTKVAQESAVEKALNELRAAENTAAIEKEELDGIEKQIEACTIKAPASGIVVYANSRFWDEGMRIRPGAQLYNRQEIFSLPDLSRMRVRLRIHESAIKKVGIGMVVTMQLDALGTRLLHGKVTKIATIAQSDGWRGAGVKQYETEVSIDDLPSDAGLKPGMTAEVKILSNTFTDAIIVPVSAITEYEGRRVVYVVKGTEIERTEVVPGEASEQHVQILGGINEGDVVALDARSRASADLKSSKPQQEKR